MKNENECIAPPLCHSREGGNPVVLFHKQFDLRLKLGQRQNDRQKFNPLLNHANFYSPFQ